LEVFDVLDVFGVYMRIAVLSDLHFGYGHNSELEEDSFLNADEALTEALQTADIVLIPGDIFDMRFPKTPMWTKAMRILSKPLLAANKGVRLVSSTKELKEISKRTLEHVPVIALHGNHEIQGENTNTLQTLENAGMLIHLEKDVVVLEKEGEPFKVAIHGMSWVPDRYAKEKMDEFSPTPIEGCFNIFVLHQSISPFLFSPLEKPSIDSSNLPKGFDLIIDGHLHWSAVQQSDSGTPILFPGSTVITQFDKAEANARKGYYMVEAALGAQPMLEFKPIAGGRLFFFEDVKIDGSLRDSVEKRLSYILSKTAVDVSQKKPLIKLKVIGKDSEYVEQDVKDMEKKYGDRAILRFVKDLTSPEIAEKVEFLRNLRDQKMSAEEIGLSVLNKSLEEMAFKKSFRPEEIFALLVDGRVEEVFSMLGEKQEDVQARL
jgi:DNA repair exonuclease SbcCD nuclease subunit